jgi:hypothetical protein
MRVQVRSRIATTLLTGQKLPALSRQDVAVRRLAPEGPSHRHAFIRFMQVCAADSLHIKLPSRSLECRQTLCFMQHDCHKDMPASVFAS